MKNKPFENFDFIDFWDDDEYAMNEYIGAPPTEEMIEETERELWDTNSPNLIFG